MPTPDTPVSWQTLFFSLLALCLNTLLQNPGHLTPKSVFFISSTRLLRLSPLVCASDILITLTHFLSLLIAGIPAREGAYYVALRRGLRREPIRGTVTNRQDIPEKPAEPEGEDEAGIKARQPVEKTWWFRCLISGLGAGSQFVKLLALRGVPISQLFGVFYFLSFVLVEVVDVLASSTLSQSPNPPPTLPEADPATTDATDVVEDASKLERTTDTETPARPATPEGVEQRIAFRIDRLSIAAISIALSLQVLHWAWLFQIPFPDVYCHLRHFINPTLFPLFPLFLGPKLYTDIFIRNTASQIYDLARPLFWPFLPLLPPAGTIRRCLLIVLQLVFKIIYAAFLLFVLLAAVFSIYFYYWYFTEVNREGSTKCCEPRWFKETLGAGALYSSILFGLYQCLYVGRVGAYVRGVSGLRGTAEEFMPVYFVAAMVGSALWYFGVVYNDAGTVKPGWAESLG